MSKFINEAAEKWLQELERTSVKQGKHYLCKDESYCCLGIACEVSAMTFEISTGVKFYSSPFSAKAEARLLPDTLIELLGLHGKCGQTKSNEALAVVEGINYTSVTELNDSGYFTFAEIAGIIRENARALFKPVDEKRVSC